MYHNVAPGFRMEVHGFNTVLQVNVLCEVHQIRYKYEAGELSIAQKPIFFQEHSKNISNCLYANLQVQGCSVEGDIRSCKIERDRGDQNLN